MDWQEWYNETIGKCTMYQLKIAVHTLGVILVITILVILIRRIIRNNRDNRK